ncbi:MAG: hypothetical protein QXE57_05080 [Nitrososphaerales archaeon]
MTINKLAQIWQVNISRMWNPGKHILVVGQSGSGKTTVLFLLAYWFYNQGETILWRDDGHLEALALAKHIPPKLFIPQGCTLKQNRFEMVEYDPYNPESIFNQLDQEKLNVICYELFVKSIEMRCTFWANLLHELPRWAAKQNTLKPIACVIDQVNELAAGRRLQIVPAQEQSSKMFHEALINFRKLKIRLVGGSHNYRDLEPGVRENFQYYWFKKTSREALETNQRFWSYRFKLEKLAVDESIVVDEDGRFNQVNVVPVEKPRVFHFPYTTAPYLETQALKDPKTIARQVLNNIQEFMSKNKVDVWRIAAAFDLSHNTAYIVKAEVERQLEKQKAKEEAAEEKTEDTTLTQPQPPQQFKTWGSKLRLAEQLGVRPSNITKILKKMQIPKEQQYDLVKAALQQNIKTTAEFKLLITSKGVSNPTVASD